MAHLNYTRPKRIIASWTGPEESINSDPDQIAAALKDLGRDIYLLEKNGKVVTVSGGEISTSEVGEEGFPVVGLLHALDPAHFGDPGFLSCYNLIYPYMAGSMANAISGIDLVLAMGKAGYLASYGAGGVPPTKLVGAIQEIKKALPDGPYAFNLIHSPQEIHLEDQTVDLFLEHQIQVIEASAFLRLTPAVVRYRAGGLSLDSSGKVVIRNKVIAKLSRPEVAVQFLNPPPDKLLQQLVESGKITAQQAELASSVPMADDITVEADSGGHTDNRPLVGLLPSITALRDQLQHDNKYPVPVRIGAGGGISTPYAVLGAFSMGAAYVVTGSINQACLEAGTSPSVKQALAEAGAPDIMMAPSADMFEMGVKVQVLKRGTMFPMRAQKLYDTYITHDSLEDLSPKLKKELEEKIFQTSLESIWEECEKFFSERDPDQLTKARQNPKRKMALVFRWYLGLATHWGIQGVPERSLDYQIWCGPSMGAFNDWVRGTSLEKAGNRSAPAIAEQLMHGASYQLRLQQLSLQGISVPAQWRR